MTSWRNLRQRRMARRTQAKRVLCKEEALARVICAAVHISGCTCEINSAPDSCSKMTWAAKRALRHLATPEARR